MGVDGLQFKSSGLESATWYTDRDGQDRHEGLWLPTRRLKCIVDAPAPAPLMAQAAPVCALVGKVNPVDLFVSHSPAKRLWDLISME